MVGASDDEQQTMERGGSFEVRVAVDVAAAQVVAAAMMRPRSGKIAE
jgi:hypothetical protein